jgi:hypothetical protein
MSVVVATNAYRTELAARAVSGDPSLVPYKVAFGDGDRVEDVMDTELENELFRVDPDSVSSDGVTLTVEVTVDHEDTGDAEFCEIGVFAETDTSEVLMGRKVFPPKVLTEPDRSVFNIQLVY